MPTTDPTAHADAVREALIAELTRLGHPCKGATWRGGFIVFIGQEVGDFTLLIVTDATSGRPKIEYQSFGETSGVTLLEPEGGFDVPAVAASIAEAVGDSRARLAAYRAARREAKAAADEATDRLRVDFGLDDISGICIEGEAKEEQAGVWCTRFSIEAYGLDEAGARRVLAAITEARSNP